MTTSGSEQPYHVPDFAADAAVIARYDAAVKAVLQAAIAEATRQVREEHERARVALENAKLAADAELRKADSEALVARAKYARLVPRRRTASGVVRPPTFFFDILLTGGQANKCYDDAIAALRTRNEAAAKARTAAAAAAALGGNADALAVKRELQVRNHYKTPQGSIELDSHPNVSPLARARAAIEAERAEYARRLAAKEVGDLELRDRTMAQEGYRFLGGDLRQVAYLRGRDVRFGQLRYSLFRDREGALFLLDALVELEPLAGITFDIIPTNNGSYLITRVTPISDVARNSREERTQMEPDPRAGVGVDPELVRALREFLERERIRA